MTVTYTYFNSKIYHMCLGQRHEVQFSKLNIGKIFLLLVTLVASFLKRLTRFGLAK